MRIPQEILEQIKDDPITGAIAACEFVEEEFNNGNSWIPSDEELLFEIYALLFSLKEAGRISYLEDAPDLKASFPNICVRISQFVDGVKEQLQSLLRDQTNERRFDNFKNHFSLALSNTFGYEFTDGDLKRIRALINELRELITDNTELDEDHKRRLLKRLERMQSEIHKKVSDLNAFYGLAVEASVVLKKVGENAKPIVDRIKELTGISWNTQARAENLPSGTEPPMLENDATPPAIE